MVKCCYNFFFFLNVEIQKALCNPGPDLVVCDEGHRIKNDYSNISQALKRIRTRYECVKILHNIINDKMQFSYKLRALTFRSYCGCG